MRRHWVNAAAALVLSLSVAAVAEAASPFGIRTLSTRPDRVSGGDVLVEVTVPNRNARVTVTLNGRDVTAAFRPGERPGSLVGLVTGLAIGRNTLAVEGRGSGLPRATLEVTNYPSTGPIVSGPHLHPFVCQTESFRLPDGTTLGAPLDSDCSVETRVQYVYWSTAGGSFRPLPSLTSLPEDVAMTTTTAGVTVPFVVRVETGSMNRGIYQNAILHDPTTEPAPTPFTPPAGWNRRLIALHGSGCPGGWYVQGAAMGANILDPVRLGEGYAFFINTLNHPTNSCNPFLAGETTMMGKEHFIETFGVPEFTVSTGGSGGAYTSLQVADAFPGLFDGVLVSATYPDALSIALSGLHERLLARYFRENPEAFTDEQKLAVTGYKGIQAFLDMAVQSQRTDPVPGRLDMPGYSSAVWNPAVPADLRYHPSDNPGGARPTIFDWARNIYGRDPLTGFARRPFDNVGVQYGLEALNAGAITPAQFLDLNERVGGYDQDANYVAARTAGDLGAIKRAYQSGVTLGGGGGLAETAVFDISLIYDDDFFYHYQWFHFAVRERMRNENGHADNHVMWRGGVSIGELLSGNVTPEGAALLAAVDSASWSALIRWLEAVAADRSSAPKRVKVVRNRPVDLVDGCWTRELAPRFIAEPQTLSHEPDSACNRLWPSWRSSRHVAGSPIDANILKCQLKPIDLADYAVTFTPAEVARLHAIFPEGVCDWSKKGVNQVPVVPWASFGPSPDNLVFDVTRP